MNKILLIELKIGDCFSINNNDYIILQIGREFIKLLDLNRGSYNITKKYFTNDKVCKIKHYDINSSKFKLLYGKYFIK